MQGFSEQVIDKLAAVFPEVITESLDEEGNTCRAVDVERLRMLLTGEEPSGKEYYAFTWAGKRRAELEAARPTDKVLRPDVEGSVRFGETENLYIEGDNLEAMKILRKSYLHRVKMIYIDPPYNTGHDFIYRDNFRVKAEEDRQKYMYDEEDGLRNFSRESYDENTKANPRYHSDWCSMIYPRLKLAKDFLTEDGVIFISIDDNEVMNLRKICDEIFGESNFIANLVWKSKSGGANDSKFFAIDHEYILVYAKNADRFTLKLDTEAEVTTSYNRSDDNGEYALDRLDKQSLGYISALDFDIIGPDGKIYRPHQKNPKHPNARWRWSKETVAQRYNELVFENGNVYTKNYKKAGAVPRSLLIDERFGRTRTGKTDLYALFEQDTFSNPKPYKLIAHFLNVAAASDSIVLDFFAGSSTTAHAVMSANSLDFGHRKFIMIQIPDPTPPNSEAAKSGLYTISQIGQERIKRAAHSLIGDTGFRLLKVASSNFNPDTFIAPDELTPEILDSLTNNIKPNRSALDLLFMCITDSGLPLSLPYSSETFEGFTIHFYGGKTLAACFDKNLSQSLIVHLAELKPERAVFRDSCFADSAAKINLHQLFKHYAPNTKVDIL